VPLNLATKTPSPSRSFSMPRSLAPRKHDAYLQLARVIRRQHRDGQISPRIFHPVQGVSKIQVTRTSIRSSPRAPRARCHDQGNAETRCRISSTLRFLRRAYRWPDVARSASIHSAVPARGNPRRIYRFFRTGCRTTTEKEVNLLRVCPSWSSVCCPPNRDSIARAVTDSGGPAFRLTAAFSFCVG